MSEENVVEQPITAESLDGSASQQEAQTVAAAHEVDEELVKEARRQGWVPKEEFTGPEDKWTDAENFVKRGKEINAILRKDNEFLKRKISELEGTMQEFSKYHAETEKRAYEKAMSDLRQQKKEAISQGDGDRVLEIDDAIDELKQAKPVPKTVAPQPDNTFIEWTEENRWYTSDAELKTEADMIGEVIKRQNPTLIGTAFLDEVTKRVKRMYPEKFNNVNRTKPSPVEAPSQAGMGKKGGKSFNDLPQEAKDACLKFEKTKLLTREQYVKEYFGE
jgi:hypothetical protein